MEQVLLEYISNNLDLSDEEIQFIIDLDIVKTYEKGAVLLKEGQFSGNEYFVFRGCLRSYYMIDGVERTTEFYTELESVSPVCVATGEPSEYYLSCIEESVILVVNPEILQSSFEKFPRFERLCRTSTEQLLAQKQAALNNFRILSPEQRYLDLLNTRPDLMQRVPQYYLASYLGITPQSLSRMRARLVKK
ncbi:MAG: Crp/Fnr family transcriptional regulator [Niabella sp.]